MEKVLKVKLKFRGSKSGRPTDDLLCSSGRPTAILGVKFYVIYNKKLCVISAAEI